MNAFLITMLVLFCIRILARLYRLVMSDYPRKTSWGSGDDALTLVISTGLALWVIYLRWFACL